MADEFPRTTVGGVSLSRMIIGTNWFLGFSHTSLAQDKFIKSYQTRENVADILAVFLNAGVNAIMGSPNQMLTDAINDAQQRTGRELIQIITPGFDVTGKGKAEDQPEAQLDKAKKLGATFCFPHTSAIEELIDKRAKVIRDIDKYTNMIRDREMIPGLSCHMPESVTYADAQGADVETYIQLYNAAGFLMQVEIDWVMSVIRNAKKPVMTIKPLAAGRLMPVVGLAFVWNTLRDQDMVTIGTTTPDEAREVIDISLDLLARRVPDYDLQSTRSKANLKAAGS
ncbi:MAG: hypothetical protein HQ592_12980 [Planctomycetes bacterium]|nr:hypothetical protein [Planctomycetota bacterium]